MKKIKSWIKLILINFVLTFSLIGMLLLAPPIVFSIYHWFTTDTKDKTSYDTRPELEIYTDFEWSDKHFIEFHDLPTTYYDFITWRRNDYVGDTINIVDGLRVTPNYVKENSKKSKYFFFGGSTTWGTGVNDENTYPSLFAKLTGNYTKNFGETAYIARQSLGYLNNYVISNSLLDMTNIHVIFYDGVNDVALRCRSEINGLGTGREKQIQDVLKNSNRNPEFSYATTFFQLKNFLNRALLKIKPDEAKSSFNEVYKCASQPQRASEIAQSLVNTWEVAANFVENRGGKFTAILQPVAYYGNANTSYLNLNSPNDQALAAQFEAVYPLIIELAIKRNFNFVNLTDVYDGCNVCYIDFCHVGPQAHQILVSSISQFLNK